MSDDDPFSVFGDDDEEEEEDMPETTAQAQKLMATANQRMLSAKTNEEESSATNDNDNTIDVSTLKPLSFSWDAPLYLGPIVCVSSLECGGGRGYVATRDLEPGTLVIVEQPVIEWPEEQLGKELGLVSVLHILELEETAQKVLHDLEDFHPSKQDVDEFKKGDEQVRNMVEGLEKSLSDELPTFVELAQLKGLSNRNGTPVNARDLVRILLALRYNGFESGVYLYLAMLNHDSYPNCVKFAATKTYSEVRTTRPVRAGEALTISYLPALMSHASRRQHLWDQHLFDISGDVPAEYEELEKVEGVIPPSSLEEKDDSATTVRIENVIDALSTHFRDAAETVIQDNSKESPVWEEAKALEVSALELYTEAKGQLQNDRHILLIPCLRLHLDACDLIQLGKLLTPNQHIMLLLRVATSSSKLVELQTLLHGKDHFDLAQTYNELSQAVSELLSRAPKQLIGLGLEGMTSAAGCSSTEYRAKKEFERIKALYPHNVEQHIKK